MLKKIWQSLQIDLKIIIPTIILLTIGYIMIFSTTSLKGLSEYNDAYYFIQKHSIFLVVGICLFFAGSIIPVRKYQEFSMIGYLLACILIILTLIPGLGIESGGAKRWLNLYGFQFQPVEFMKFWWAVAASVILCNKKKKLSQFVNGMLPVFLIVFFPIGLLMMQPDLGNSILMLLTAFCLLLLSSLPISVLILSGIGALGVIIGSILMHPYQLSRIQSFLNPWIDPLGVNYHIIQSFTAIGSGGVFGFGLGESRLKYFYLPLHYSDFIFSILCEEGGIILAAIVIFSFFWIFLRGVQIALKYDAYSFEQFLSIAITCYLIFQAIINICVVIGLFPITGIPLTFISYGGTSLLISLFSLGVLCRLGAYS